MPYRREYDGTADASGANVDRVTAASPTAQAMRPNLRNDFSSLFSMMIVVALMSFLLFERPFRR
jgi:hypothetical protein